MLSAVKVLAGIELFGITTNSAYAKMNMACAEYARSRAEANPNEPHRSSSAFVTKKITPQPTFKEKLNHIRLDADRSWLSGNSKLSTPAVSKTVHSVGQPLLNAWP